MTKIWNQWKQYLLAVALISAAAWVAAQQTQEPPQQAAPLDIPGEGTVLQPLGRTYAAPPKTSPKAARVTLYRPVSDARAGVAHLAVNGQYHTSLQSGAYSEMCIQPREFSLAAHMVQADTDDTVTPSSFSFKTIAAQDFYVRLNVNPNNLTDIALVSDKVAQQELQNTRRQIHVATRVSDLAECVEPAILKTENITLSSDALFGFGKSDIDGFSAQGRNALDALIATLQKQYGSFDKIQINIVGHADPIGNPNTNRRISAARAQTIRAYMVKGGLDPNKITSEGRGDTEPVITTCAKTAKPENIACNQPNRRVVVVVQQLDR